MAYDNHGMNDSMLNIPSEPRGAYTGSNQFILNEDERKTTRDHLRAVAPWCRQRARNIFRKKTLYKRLPILSWLPKYSGADAVGDLVAGITVGLTVIPQALAYAGIAGLPAAYGLYGSFMGCFVYIILGSHKDVPLGPTAIASLLTLQASAGVWQRAVLLGFLTGIIEILMGILGLGFLLDFVSGPVNCGFTSAVALIILSSQVKDVLGIAASGNTFVQMWTSIIEHIQDTRLWDTVLGIVCIIVLLLMRMIANVKIGPVNNEDKTTMHKAVNKILWLIGTSRNAILVVITGGIGAAVHYSGHAYFKLIGEIPPGLPAFQAPPFSIPAVTNGTEILQEEESFTEMVSNLGSGLIVIPLIALLENMAICKAFADGKTIDASQELIAIGTANVFNSFVQGYPGNGALSRGAVNHASGARTPMGSLYTGILVILALLFFTPYFYYIPRAALAAIIIAAVIFMVEVRVIKPMWRSKKTDLLPGIAAFIACLALPLEFGILVGIGINVIFILYHSARPKISVELCATTGVNSKYLMITPDRCLIFPSTEYVRNLVNKQGLKSQTPVVIDCSHIYGADYTAATVVETLVSDFESRNQKILFYNLKPSVLHVFEGVDNKILVYYDFDALERMINEK
ncbi:sodium-independent sulfate anion transporter-like [Phlebotomus argentipes]|uniref:sodium-independent sulfate anion transporter-like n=1 Tax=Phlebotomus argentipes TaxID=94469 RepID=UPI0028933A8D|nr:sodium-independent sulfate anion transporter-like [Phlebotomus argentipes]